MVDIDIVVVVEMRGDMVRLFSKMGDMEDSLI